MLELDGKVVDLTKPETLKGITFKEGGYIEQSKDGTAVRIEKENEWKSHSNSQSKK